VITATIEVTVKRDTKPPEFLNVPSYVKSISESRAAGVSVFSYSAKDPDLRVSSE
jgi:hypothetical protein